MFSSETSNFQENGSPKLVKSPSKSFSTKYSPHSPKIMGDRFISMRNDLDSEISQFHLKENKINENCSVDTTPAKEEYKATLAETLFPGKFTLNTKVNGQLKVMSFKGQRQWSSLSGCPIFPQTDSGVSGVREIHSASAQSRLVGVLENKLKANRQISTYAEKILDAPNLVDDYYLNLLDWSAFNILAIALGRSVFLWNAESGEIFELLSQEPEQNIVTSISFSKEGTLLGVGTNDCEVQIWDVSTQKLLRTMRGHGSRVGSLDWNGAHPHLLSSASRDTVIVNHDVRERVDCVARLENHTQEVCGLKWSCDGSTLASGGNDNLLNIWDLNRNEPLFTSNRHQAAVKALAWCPFQSNLLASGGGTADRTIKFWNTSSGACINSVDTKSQVCSIVWSTHYKELLSSQGFSQNQLLVWKYPTMNKVAELKGHTARVLHLARSPDGKTVASAAADETLRFWKVFDVQNSDSSPSSPHFQTPIISKQISPSTLCPKQLRLR